MLKRAGLPSHEETSQKLKCTLLSESSRSEKAPRAMISIPCHSGKGKTMGTVKTSVVPRDEEEGRKKSVQHREFLGQ